MRCLRLNLHVDEVEHVVGQRRHVVPVSVQLHLEVLRAEVLHPLDDLGLDSREVGGVQPADGVCKLFAPIIRGEQSTHTYHNNRTVGSNC